MSDDADEPLHGGNVTAGLVRRGDTVRRPRHAWSESVDAFLAHLRSCGVTGVPEPLGYDDESRQVLSFIAGDVSADPRDLDERQLGDVGALIRQIHDASASFAPDAGARWNVAFEPDRHELVCHNDLAPWNLVRGANGVSFIDFDGAGWGSRLWDLAYACHGFVPMSSRASLDDATAAARLSALVDGYGLSARERVHLVDLLVARIVSMYELLRRGDHDEREPWCRLWREGHGDLWHDDALYCAERLTTWHLALGVAETSGRDGRGPKRG